MMAIKYIIFDNNGVLTTSHHENVDAAMAKATGVSKRKMHDAILLHAPLLDKGKIRDIEFSRRVAKTVGSNISPALLSYTRIVSYQPKKDVMRFAKQLSKKYAVALLSNFGDSFWIANKRWHLENIFKKKAMFVSSELGMCKPHRNIYREVTRRLRCKPDEIVFIDDNTDNIRNAKAYGINTVLFKNLEQLKKALMKYNIK